MGIKLPPNHPSTNAPLYHGSRSTTPFDQFQTKWGAFFSTDQGYALAFQNVAKDWGETPIPLITAEITAKNPKFYDGENPVEFETFTQTRRSAEEIHALGFDSEILLFADGHFDIAVYAPSQIRIVPSCLTTQALTESSPSQRINNSPTV